MLVAAERAMVGFDLMVWRSVVEKVICTAILVESRYTTVPPVREMRVAVGSRLERRTMLEKLTLAMLTGSLKDSFMRLLFMSRRAKDVRTGGMVSRAKPVAWSALTPAARGLMEFAGKG